MEANGIFGWVTAANQTKNHIPMINENITETLLYLIIVSRFLKNVLNIQELGNILQVLSRRRKWFTSQLSHSLPQTTQCSNIFRNFSSPGLLGKPGYKCSRHLETKGREISESRPRRSGSQMGLSLKANWKWGTLANISFRHIIFSDSSWVTAHLFFWKNKWSSHVLAGYSSPLNYWLEMTGKCQVFVLSRG